MTAYYDYILGAIPLVMVIIPATLVATGVALTTAVPVGGLVAVSLIGHAMFANPPVTPQGTPTDFEPEPEPTPQPNPAVAMVADD